MSQVGFVIGEIAYFIMGVVSLITLISHWKMNSNRMLIAVSVYVCAVLLRSLIDVAIYAFDLNIDVILAGGLTIGMVIGFILFTIQLEFLLYLKDLPKLYTLPLFISFYLALGRVLVDSAMPFIIYAMTVSYGSAYFLIRDGKRKRNGLAIGMGLFFLIYGLGSTFQVEFLFVTLRVIAMAALLLGTRGFYEKYVFVNAEEEQKIMGTWIAKLVVKE
ncbi:MAG: hypothetical protein ACFE96_17075 [Candidatus Hermodarchaeota archaeon]